MPPRPPDAGLRDAAPTDASLTDVLPPDVPPSDVPPTARLSAPPASTAPAARRRAVVTRPAAQAAPWVAQLQALGVDAVALPLIGIEPVDDAAPLQRAWAELPGCALAMFVSANAVQHFFAARPAGAGWPPGVLAGSTGPGTSAALRAAGVPAPALVEPDPALGVFDTDALWQQRLAGRDWRGRAVQVLRGEDGRDWLAQTLAAHGAQVRFVAAYRRVAPRLDAAGAAVVRAALADPAAHLWQFGSSQAARHLRALWPDADWSASHAVAGHPRIAEAVRAAGFGDVALLAPDVQALAAACGAPAGATAPPQHPSVQSDDP